MADRYDRFDRENVSAFDDSPDGRNGNNNTMDHDNTKKKAGNIENAASQESVKESLPSANQSYIIFSRRVVQYVEIDQRTFF